MITRNILLALFVSGTVISCSHKDQRYIDLETNKRIDVAKDSTNGNMVNAETNQPVNIYVDTQTNDTIYGKSGKIINGHVTKTLDGKYKYISDGGEIKIKSDENTYKIKDGDYKKKVDKDGNVKIKQGDTKIKIDGETGKKTIKND